MRLIVSLLLGLGAFGAGAALGDAQAVHLEKVPPKVMSGEDFGFRIEGRRGDTPVGTLVVRINGEWVEVEFGAGVKRITK